MAGFAEQRIGGTLRLDAHDGERRAFVDGPDRVDQPAADADVDRLDDKLLDRAGISLREHEIDLDAHGREHSLVDPDIDRPQVRRRRADPAGNDGLDRTRRAGVHERAAKQHRLRRAREDSHRLSPVYFLFADFFSAGAWSFNCAR